MTRVRCAIYTRKSSEEGLDQDFNSLDAQFEACDAYIKSQASEGWLLGKERYDDGGISGGTLARPGLNRLLEDIAAGRIDIVVVYKVDRLTRSLLDFAKLVEAFDKAGTSFVSITQSFNTTTSMGRLTLNMLLSFAQFEREVTAERIRDKIAQSKARGMWMGGNPPLGYRPEGRSLAIVEQHATLVRDMFARYLRLGNMRLLHKELLSSGIVKPDRTTATGRAYGGATFNRSELYNMLGNRIYVGDIVHRDKVWPGLHQPIIDPETFARAQELLSRHVKGDRTPRDAEQQSLLASRVVDERGEPLVATHASKKTAAGKRRYRYYVTRGLLQGNGKGMRIPALELEHVVVAQLTEMLVNPLSVLEHHATTDAPVTERAIQRGQELAAELRGSRVEGQRALVRRMVGKVIVSDNKVTIKVEWPALCDLLFVPVHAADDAVLLLETAARLTRSGRAIRMIQHDGRLIRSTVDLTLVRLIVKARNWWQRLQDERGLTVTGLAANEDVTQSYVTRILRLAFLSPDVVKSIMNGRQPAWLDSGSLCSRDSISLDWDQQKHNLLLGRAS
jgi:DNA invertase Pin-like site-specific DNA recombinase